MLLILQTAFAQPVFLGMHGEEWMLGAGNLPPPHGNFLSLAETLSFQILIYGLKLLSLPNTCKHMDEHKYNTGILIFVRRISALDQIWEDC